jgi:hypothetical protein
MLRNEFSTSFWDTCALFRLHCQTFDTWAQKLIITPDAFAKRSTSEKGKRLTLTFAECTAPGASGLGVVVNFDREESELVGTIEVRSAGLRCERVEFPYVEWRQVDQGEALLIPAGWVGEIRRPRENIAKWVERSRTTKHGWQHFTPVEGDEVLFMYPSILDMQYMMLYTAGHCLYLASYSTGSDTLSFRASNIHDGLRLSVNHHPFLTDGTWISPQCAVAHLPADWHAAADLYAGHMRPRFSKPANPAWLREDFHGWSIVIVKFEGQPPTYRFADLPALARRVKELGIPVLHIAGWMGNGHDTLYPDYEPCPECGTAAELKAALDEIHAMGVRPVLYTNGRILDPQSKFYQNGGRDTRCVSAGGTPNVELYGNSVKFEVACPMDKRFREQMVSRVKAMVSEYGARAVQIDQISSADAVMCHNPAHGHERPSANILPGYDIMLQEIRDAGRALDPDFFVWVEGCHERFAQFYDVSQSGDETDGCGLDVPRPEQFTFVYPHLRVTGPASSSNLLCHTFCQGKAMDLSSDKLFDEDLCGLLQKFVALRKALPRYFMSGTFRDNVGLDIAGSARGFRLVRDDGKADVVNLWVTGSGPQQSNSAWVRKTRSPGRVSAHFPAGLSIAEQGEWLRVEWQGPVATISIEQ